MKVDRIEETRLTAEDEAAIGRLLDAAFSSDYDGRSYFQNRHHVRFIIREDDQIIGHMALGLRAIRIGDRLVQAAGLAEVATDPQHRGKGIASTLMESVITEAKQSVADFLILFGDEPLYAGVGFQSKPNRTLSVSMHGVQTGPEENRQGDKLMILQLKDRPWDDRAFVDLVGFAF